MIRSSPVASSMPSRTARPLPEFFSSRRRITPSNPAATRDVPIGRVVVDDDHFLADTERLEIDSLNLLEQCADEPLLVVRRDDDRQHALTDGSASRRLRGTLLQRAFDDREVVRRVDADRFRAIGAGECHDRAARSWPRG